MSPTFLAGVLSQSSTKSCLSIEIYAPRASWSTTDVSVESWTSEIKISGIENTLKTLQAVTERFCVSTCLELLPDECHHGYNRRTFLGLGSGRRNEDVRVKSVKYQPQLPLIVLHPGP